MLFSLVLASFRHPLPPPTPRTGYFPWRELSLLLYGCFIAASREVAVRARPLSFSWPGLRSHVSTQNVSIPHLCKPPSPLWDDLRVYVYRHGSGTSGHARHGLSDPAHAAARPHTIIRHQTVNTRAAHRMVAACSLSS